MYTVYTVKPLTNKPTIFFYAFIANTRSRNYFIYLHYPYFFYISPTQFASKPFPLSEINLYYVSALGISLKTL